MHKSLRMTNSINILADFLVLSYLSAKSLALNHIGCFWFSTPCCSVTVTFLKSALALDLCHSHSHSQSYSTWTGIMAHVRSEMHYGWFNHSQSSQLSAGWRQSRGTTLFLFVFQFNLGSLTLVCFLYACVRLSDSLVFNLSSYTPFIWIVLFTCHLRNTHSFGVFPQTKLFPPPQR